MAQDINPIKSIRVQLNLTLAELALAAGIDRLIIVRTEQGCFNEIPPKLLHYLLRRTNYPEHYLASNYRTWVAENRRRNYGKLSSRLPIFSESKHPFKSWREASDLGKLEVCRLYCVHPSTLGRFENNLVMQTVPTQLSDALSESGYSQHLLSDLGIRYNLYREYQLAMTSGDSNRIKAAYSSAMNYHQIYADAS